MDREIKFRGLNRSGEWVFGGIYTRYEGKTLCAYITVHDFKTETVLHETVGQYTGLKDKNGVEIFEGDVVTWGENVETVFWCSDAVGFQTETSCLDSESFTVVGNIYETPELLNKENS